MRHASVSLSPDFTLFESKFNAGKSQLVWTRLVADLETPVSAMLKLMEPGVPAFLLESVEGGEVRGRYSIIGLYPDLMWRCRGNSAEICREDGFADRDFIPCTEGALASLRALIKDTQLDMPPELPPMAAGLIGYMGYDMVKLMERLPASTSDAIGIPDGCFIRPRAMLVFDAVAGVIFIVTAIWNRSENGGAKSAYNAAAARIEHVVERLARPIDASQHYRDRATAALNFSPSIRKPDYLKMVERAKEYIAAGDIFQVVLSQRFSTPFALPPFSLYRAVRHLNPSPFLFYLHFASHTLVGASPEILVRLRDGKVTVRPIAGTRKRGKTREEDATLATELLADEKEIAEHLMLLDLGRNDVGRIAVPGSVNVTDKMIVERYSHVMHIVSNVEGILQPGKDAIDALAAGFPAGTVSGAPKIRAMEIIDELEPAARSFYAGCVGYFSADGGMDTCITLRTGLIKDGMLHLQAGGGIVADSTPEGEYEECLNKSRALMKAAEEAVKFTFRAGEAS